MFADKNVAHKKNNKKREAAKKKMKRAGTRNVFFFNLAL